MNQIVVNAQKNASRKSYQAPKLVTHGGVEKLTLHTSGCFSDIHDKKPKGYGW
jgi:hypothetical protein